MGRIKFRNISILAVSLRIFVNNGRTVGNVVCCILLNGKMVEDKILHHRNAGPLGEGEGGPSITH